MTTIDQTAFAKLNTEQHLQNPVFKEATKVKGRFGFRGEIAIKFAPKLADEARPAEVTVDQVIATAMQEEGSIQFLAAYLLSFEYLKLLSESLNGSLKEGGKYFLFCNNIDLLKKYQVTYEGVTFYVLPLDESTVYNELLDLLRLEKGDLKKLDSASKIDAIANAALKFASQFPVISFEEGLQLMGPVRNPNENRPV